MNVASNIVHYLARTLAILLAAFLSVFILEGFDPAYGWQSGVGHAIPAAIAITIGILAHLHPRIGGWTYISFGVLLVVVVMANTIFQGGMREFLERLWTTIPLLLFIAGIGALFLLDARMHKQEDKGIRE